MARQTKRLVDEARSLGIDVDGRWGDETIQEKIDEAKAAKAAETEGKGDAEGGGEGTAEAGGVDTVDRGVSAGGSDGTGSAIEGDASSTEDPATGFGDGDGAASGSAAPGDGEQDVTPVAGDGDGGDAAGDPAVLADGDGDLGGPVGDQVDHVDGSADSDQDEDGDDFLDDDARDRDLAAARAARTPPMSGAFFAASSVYGALVDRSRDNLSIDPDWFGMNMDSAELTIGVVSIAVPFVRTYPDAPVAALYGQVASGGGINLNLDRPWADLELAERIAWTVFRDTLVTIDRLTAAEPKPEAEPQDIHRVPIDETTMERVDDPLQLAELAGGPR